MKKSTLSALAKVLKLVVKSISDGMKGEGRGAHAPPILETCICNPQLNKSIQ